MTKEILMLEECIQCLSKRVTELEKRLSAIETSLQWETIDDSTEN